MERRWLRQLRYLLRQTYRCRRQSVAWKRSYSKNRPQLSFPSPRNLHQLRYRLAVSLRKTRKPRTLQRMLRRDLYWETVSLGDRDLGRRLRKPTANDMARHLPPF
jgi:hypothetical protein